MASARKRVFIVHGWDGSPKEGWFPWFKKELQKRGFRAEALAMPDSAHPKIGAWTRFLSKRVGKLDEKTYFVGHSIGCQTILRYLEKANGKAGGVVLVAGWLALLPAALPDEDAKRTAKPWLTRKIDFRKVKPKARKFAAILSDNDPYVSLSNAKVFRSKLGAKVLVEGKKGHFSGGDGVRKLPSALRTVEALAGS